MAQAHIPDCEFCKISTKDAPAELVFESDHAMAFIPLRPAAVGHTLVIPKAHVPNLYELGVDTGARLMEAAIRVANAIKEALSPDGMNLITSAGSAATQTIFHIHLHLVPRWHGDHIGNLWPPSEPWSEATTEGVAGAIRDAVVMRSSGDANQRPHKKGEVDHK
ncbi:HIT family protein [Micromonospora sp. NPDC001898]|uniref:HIT family protein n=1 Tax=Micromonospora sp. NPDC001898 TaxID=3364221 RepID=UPI003676F32D